MCGCAGLVAWCEVIENDHPADCQPPVGGVEGRVIRWFLALAAAVEHQQVEGSVFA